MAGILLVLILAAATDTADVEEGLANFRQGRFAEAYQAWSQAASREDARGALYLGVLYDSGEGVPQDYAQAMAWYRRAADAGNAAGAFNVGVLYDAGLGVPKDPTQAAVWYARAATGKFGRAFYNLAMLYEYGTGVRKNRQRAIALYRKAASQGISAARTHLASLGQPYDGVISPENAGVLQVFQQAQQLIVNRGPAELARAATLFRDAAAQHNALAEYDLGYCYEHGLGVPQDDVQAMVLYRRAASDTPDPALRSVALAGADFLERQIKRAK